MKTLDPRSNSVTRLLALAAFGLATLPAWAQAQSDAPITAQGDFDAQVVGGEPAKAGRWPFMVSLVRKSVASNYNAHSCGGSLISSRDVLTAAHCITGASPSSLQILVGTQDLKSGGRRVNITRITKHPSYKPATNDSDVAVIRLAEDVTDIVPVEYVSTVEQETQYAPPGRISFGMGWGETETTPHFPSVLYNVKLPIVDAAVCNAPDAYNGKITGTMICAGYPEGGKDTCQGDSGGPLVVKDANKKFHLQVGVVSWGYGCAEPKKYGVYSRLATLGSWVKDQVAKP